MTASPLMERDLQQAVAWLSSGLDEIELPAGVVSGEQFLQQVLALCEFLPEQGPIINLCHNRYLFLLGLCAAIVKHQTTLLPPNKRASAQASIAKQYPGAYLLHDGTDELADLVAINLRTGLWHKQIDHGAMPLMPSVDPDFTAVISYTSGSTGNPKPNLKTWRTLRASTHINARYMLAQQDDLQYHLATVPSQHMWGLETSVLMALFKPVCIADTQPLFPADIQQELNKLPTPKTLISTPFHLRSLRAIDTNQLRLDRVLCATAPLSRALAKDIEQGFETTVQEVYGCSEVGSMAVRRTAQTDAWTPFEGLHFQSTESATVVSSEYLPQEIQLEDRLAFNSHGLFRLQGRESDTVKVAGKRGSLTQINQLILGFDGVLDGIAFMPPQDRPVPRLAALVVLQDPANIKALLQYLRTHLDSAFVPRPLLCVSSLPREENGKLTQARLLKYFQTIRS